MFLPKTYFPSHAENRMKGEGNVQLARESFLRERPSNLKYLLEQRYAWMNEYLDGKEKIVEVGAGAGLSKEFIRNQKLILTDFNANPWIDIVADALHPPFGDGSIEAVVSSHMIHHLAKPLVFFREIRRILKPGGLLLIQEINTSLMMRLLLRLARHEGWSYEINVFDESTVANDPKDPWSANCAIPQLLFEDSGKFEAAAPGFRVLRNELCEFMIFPLSGGVTAKTAVPRLPWGVLRAVDGMDRVLVRVAPSVFGLGRRVVIQKTG